MKGYGQFCPIAKASEVLGERWTHLVIRELIKIIERDCERQSIDTRHFVECLDTWQKRRGEIWVFGSTQRYRVFVHTREPSPRRTA